MISYKISYILAGFSFFAAIISAITHNLTYTLVNVFFVIWNWEMAEWNRRKADEATRKSDSETEE